MKIKPFASHDVGVGDWVGDGNVSVHADDDQVEDAGGAGPHVHTEPDEAEVPAKDPSVHHLVDCGERQDQDAQQQVGHCQGHDEGVGGTGQLGGDLDSDDHQDVPEGDDETYQTQGNQRANNLEHGLVLETLNTVFSQRSAIIPSSRLYSLYLNVQEAFNNIGIL